MRVDAITVMTTTWYHYLAMALGGMCIGPAKPKAWGEHRAIMVFIHCV
jgi:hypothetical protein